jgi:hypothetical protein
MLFSWPSKARAAQGLVAALLDRLLEDAQGMPGAMGEYYAWLKRGLSAGYIGLASLFAFLVLLRFS